MDFSNCKNDDFHTYSGKSKKTQIIYNNKSYLVKYRKKENGKDIFFDFSEYISCKIFESFGLETQNVILGEIKGKDCVACQNFLKDNEVLQEFSNFINNSAYGKEYSFEKILNTIDTHPNIFNKEDVKEKFWKMYILDSFLGNSNRSSSNWGFVVSAKQKYSKFSPIYSCGFCLYPQISDKEIDKILGDKKELETNILLFPASKIMKDNDNTQNSNYAQTINSLNYEGCNNAIKWFVNNLNFQKIDNIINNTVKLSNKRKKFYSIILRERFNYIIKPAYEKLNKLNEEKG